ncbi:hypothetical protein PR048_019631 [Dryococelus australis]|uniref:Uncharacterized protein n=1 Tax=Dryococelus australis TaxID=614101 RepID=A0ABQ9H443_9NEOP|nr:hypothetical protein PR048_019631 [Dryococelus australis]
MPHERSGRRHREQHLAHHAVWPRIVSPYATQDRQTEWVHAAELRCQAVAPAPAILIEIPPESFQTAAPWEAEPSGTKSECWTTSQKPSASNWLQSSPVTENTITTMLLPIALTIAETAIVGADGNITGFAHVESITGFPYPSVPPMITTFNPQQGDRIFACGKSCQTMLLVGGFSRGSPVSTALSFQHCSILTSITLIGSQDLAVKSLPNLFTHSLTLTLRSWTLRGVRENEEREGVGGHGGMKCELYRRPVLYLNSVVDAEDCVPRRIATAVRHIPLVALLEVCHWLTSRLHPHTSSRCLATEIE